MTTRSCPCKPPSPRCSHRQSDARSPCERLGLLQGKQMCKAQRLAEAEERVRLSRYASPAEKLQAQCAWTLVLAQISG